jgi:hypothetical protein
VFKIYLRVFKILFKGVQHIYNTYINFYPFFFFFFSFAFNTSRCVIAHPHQYAAAVITPFLPPKFSRVSTRKTRQPEPSRPVPTRAHHTK